MKKDQVQVGGRYSAKVSGSVVEVRITGERWVGDDHRGWNAVNTATNRPVVIKSAQRLRGEVRNGAAPAPGAAQASPEAAVAPKANPAPPDAPGANVAPATAKATPIRAIKVIGAKPAKPITLSDEAAYAVDRRTPPEAIPYLEREVARLNAAGSPRPPAAKKSKGKAAKPAKAKSDKPKRLSGLDAVAKVLHEAGKPMSAKEMVEEALKRKLWATGGKTPEATVYAAIIRDIAARGKESRFRKTGRGQFAAAGKGA